MRILLQNYNLIFFSIALAFDMIIGSTERVPLEKCPALVLNADFRPLSYYPLSLWCWQDAVKSVFRQGKHRIYL